MYRVKIVWEWIPDGEPVEVIDAEIISDQPAEDPQFEQRLADLGYLEALAASVES